MVKDHEHASTCPYCGKHNDMAGSMPGQRARPKDGDVSLCIGCGHVGVFDSRAPGGLRKTSPLEAATLAANPQMSRARLAWQMMDQMRRARAKA